MFKPGDLIKCINDKNKSFRRFKPKNSNVKFLTKGKIYKVLKPYNPYNTNVFIINDEGNQKFYSPKRFYKVSRKEKINKIIDIINGKAKKSIM